MRSFLYFEYYCDSMVVLTREEFKANKYTYFDAIKAGALFIHPTDTIYGLGCSAMDKIAVVKLRSLKQNYDRPFSVIAPSKDWIRENCIITPLVESWLSKLPGAYTLILSLKNSSAVASETNVGLRTLGIRIPKHWFSKVASLLGSPIITTSANRVGNGFMTSVDNLDEGIAQAVDFVIYEGEKNGVPSTIIDLTKEQETITSRKDHHSAIHIDA